MKQYDPYEDFGKYEPSGNKWDWLGPLLLLLSAGFVVWVMVFCIHAASAEDMEFMKPQSHHGYDPNDARVKWFEQLERPKCPTKEPCFCCGKTDAYPIVIDQEAILEGDEPTGTGHVLDGSPKTYPDGTKREELPNGLVFKFPGNAVTKLKQGNPTGTAWGFFSVWPPNTIHTIWCVVPLPPGF